MTAGREGGRNMHSLVLYCAAHRAILRTASPAYHVPQDGTVAGQSSFVSLDRRSDERLTALLALAVLLRGPQGSSARFALRSARQPGRLGERGPGYWSIITITHENHDRPCDEAHVAASRPQGVVLCLESLDPVD